MSESLFSVRNALRILALILLCVMLFITIKNSVVISKGNEKIQAQQLETLTKVLISQASLSASELQALLKIFDCKMDAWNRNDIAQFALKYLENQGKNPSCIQGQSDIRLGFDF